MKQFMNLAKKLKLSAGVISIGWLLSVGNPVHATTVFMQPLSDANLHSHYTVSGTGTLISRKAPEGRNFGGEGPASYGSGNGALYPTQPDTVDSVVSAPMASVEELIVAPVMVNTLVETVTAETSFAADSSYLDAIYPITLALNSHDGVVTVEALTFGFYERYLRNSQVWQHQPFFEKWGKLRKSRCYEWTT